MHLVRNKGVPASFLDCFDEVDSPTHKAKSRGQEHNFRKNMIKINRNRLPSDFFGANKPSSVSASNTHRNNKSPSRCPSPMAKHSSHNAEAKTRCPDTDNEEDSDVMRQTSNFGGSVPIEFSPQKRESQSTKKYSSLRDTDSPQLSVGDFSKRETSKDSQRTKTSKKMPFFAFQHREPHQECQLPRIRASPLRVRI